MKKSTELCTLLKAFVLISAIAFCVMGLAVGSFAAKNNTEFITSGTKTETVTVSAFFAF